MGPPLSHAYQQTKATLLRNNIPTMPLTRDNFARHIPNVNLAEGDEALVDIGAGILYADRAVKVARVRGPPPPSPPSRRVRPLMCPPSFFRTSFRKWAESSETTRW